MATQYCPNGHPTIAIDSTWLYHDCFYCQDCDNLYELQLKPVDLSRLPDGRFEQLRDFALIREARKKVKKEDLVRLGLLPDRK